MERCRGRGAVTASAQVTVVCQMPEKPVYGMEPRWGPASFLGSSLHPGCRSEETDHVDIGWRCFGCGVQEGRNLELQQGWVSSWRLNTCSLLGMVPRPASHPVTVFPLCSGYSPLQHGPVHDRGPQPLHLVCLKLQPLGRRGLCSALNLWPGALELRVH